jgi:hypothetical protein
MFGRNGNKIEKSKPNQLLREVQYRNSWKDLKCDAG